VKYWQDALIRALKTFAQALIAVIGTDAIGITDVDWAAALGVAALAGVLSLLTSVATIPLEGDKVDEKPLDEVDTSEDGGEDATPAPHGWTPEGEDPADEFTPEPVKGDE
jgi:hypothetical protein